MRHGQAKDVVRLSEITNKFIPIFELDRKIGSFTCSKVPSNAFLNAQHIGSKHEKASKCLTKENRRGSIFSLQIIDP
jgi:hypothetical protein